MDEKKYELIKFNDGEFSLDVNVSPSEDTVWLSQNDIAALFNTTKQNVNFHVKNIIFEKELSKESTVKYFFTVQSEGNRTITRNIKMYNLDMILSIGYRVKSNRGNLFRRWANQVLRQYLLNGYTINEERCLVCNSSILELTNEVKQLKSKIQNLEDNLYQENENYYTKVK